MATSESHEIEVSAPGKVILHGEHAVVYGKAAIAGSLDLRCHMKVKKIVGSLITFESSDIGIKRQIDTTALKKELQSVITEVPPSNPVPASDIVIKAIRKFLELEEGSTDSKQLALIACIYLYCSIFIHREDLPAIDLQIKSEIPVGAGLGSSAAFSVALSAALLQLAGIVKCESASNNLTTWPSTDLDTINKWAFIGEKVIHGQPSGIDNSISTYGGALRFQKGELTHLERIPTLSMMLVNTQVPRSTKTLVSNVRQKYNTYPEIFDPVLTAIEAITEKAQVTLKNLKETGNRQELDTLGELIDINQQFLNLMGVGHSALDQVISVAKDEGFHGKLTGAGGGGCAIILLPPSVDTKQLDTMNQRYKELGFHAWSKISFGGKGVLLHL